MNAITLISKLKDIKNSIKQLIYNRLGINSGNKFEDYIDYVKAIPSENLLYCIEFDGVNITDELILQTKVSTLKEYIINGNHVIFYLCVPYIPSGCIDAKYNATNIKIHEGFTGIDYLGIYFYGDSFELPHSLRNITRFGIYTETMTYFNLNNVQELALWALCRIRSNCTVQIDNVKYLDSTLLFMNLIVLIRNNYTPFILVDSSYSKTLSNVIKVPYKAVEIYKNDNSITYSNVTYDVDIIEPLTLEIIDIPEICSWNTSEITVKYRLTGIGKDNVSGEYIDDYSIEEETTITNLEVNDDYDNDRNTLITINISGLSASAYILYKKRLHCAFTVDLNNEWEETSINPDPTKYVAYRSFSNKDDDSEDTSRATIIITINNYSEFTIYGKNQNSEDECEYDYLVFGKLDITTPYYGTSKISRNTRNRCDLLSEFYGTDCTDLTNYTKVTYTDIDEEEHTIKIAYCKDDTINEGEDRGYILIPIDQ